MKKFSLKKSILFTFVFLAICTSMGNVQSAQIYAPNDIINNFDSRFTSVFLNYGDGFANKEEFDLAESFYRKAVDLEPHDIQAQYRLGLILEFQNKFAEAEQ